MQGAAKLGHASSMQLTRQYRDEPTDLDPAYQEREPSYGEAWRRELLGGSEFAGRGDDWFDRALIHFMVWSDEFYLCFDSSQDYNTFGMVIYYYISDIVYVRYSPSLRVLLSRFADDLEAGKCVVDNDDWGDLTLRYPTAKG